ncbi:hypothetical protein K469DRAFT_52912 [Zopfia rhizophila CBS 207.26]|uniref:Uncharacterized protein n=1 Tax=Zopfia rhizophila CBS 207.26 TaxID=1314779 RepID=A0A6A6D8H4_9PEZI|nr:hypothetical protein K469DRAFT_52912 [Zopfia rhizophila CBS 207.26]
MNSLDGWTSGGTSSKCGSIRRYSTNTRGPSTGTNRRRELIGSWSCSWTGRRSWTNRGNTTSTSIRNAALWRRSLAKERIRKAKQNGSVGVSEAVLLKRAADMVRYREKISQAQKEVEMAQKRLEVLRVEELLSTAERNILTKQAEQDLESAQKRLEAEKSDEME